MFVGGAVHNEAMKPALSPAPTPVALLAMLLAAAVHSPAGGCAAVPKAPSAGQAGDIVQTPDLLALPQALRATNLTRAQTLLADLEANSAGASAHPLLWNAKGLLFLQAQKLPEAYTAFSKALDVAGAQTPQSILTQVLSNRCVLLRRMGRLAEAGLDYRRAKGLPLPVTADQPGAAGTLPDFHLATEVSVELGEANREVGLWQIEWADGATTPANVVGQTCRRIKPSRNQSFSYVYFAIEPTFKWSLGPQVQIEVEYCATARGVLDLQYDSIRGRYQPCDQDIPLTADGTWTRAVFQVRDARFENSENGRADFRLIVLAPEFAVRRVTVLDRKNARPERRSLPAALAGTNWIQSRPPGSQLPFYQLRLHPEDLTELERLPRLNDRYPGTFIAEGETFEPVEVRNRGDWARTWAKKPLKIFLPPSQPYAGQHVLNLNPGWRDPAFVRETLAYHLYERCGVPASRSRWVRLHVNGRFRGLYVEVEQPDKAFLRRHHLSGASLFKATSTSRQSDERDLGSDDAYAHHYSRETRKDEGFAELHQFCRDLEQTRDVLAFFNRQVDVAEYASYLAVMVLIENWDCPNKNHYLAHDVEGSGKWLVIPWDLDRTFGDHWHQYFTEARLPILLGTRQSPGPTGWNRMADRFLNEPTLRQRFLDRLAELIEKEFTAAKLFPLLDRYEAELGPEVALDRQRWGGGDGDLHRGLAGVKTYIEQRRVYVLGELPKLRWRNPPAALSPLDR